MKVCIVLILAGCCCALVHIIDYIQEKESEVVTELCSQAYARIQEQDFAAAEELYIKAFEVAQVDTIASRLIQWNQASGDTKGAIEWLNVYEEVDKKSDFTTLRRAHIYIQEGSLDLAKTLLHSIVDSPIKLSPVVFFRPIIDKWLYSDQDYTSAVNHYQYYVDYMAKLTALQWLLIYATDMDEAFALGQQLFLLAEDCEDDYAIMNQFLRYQHVKVGSLYFSKYMRGMGSAALDVIHINDHIKNSLAQPNFNSNNILTHISDTKWSIFNYLITTKHLVEGFDAAVEYINRITVNNTQNTDTYQMYGKFIYGIYLAASGSDAFDRVVTKEEMDAILLNSVDENGHIPFVYLTIGDVGILGNEDRDAIQGDEVRLPIIVLGCNDWTCYDTTQSFGEYNAKHKGERKTMRYIDTNFKVRSSYTDRDMFGLNVHSFPSNLMCLNLLQAVYDKQVVAQ